MSNGLYRYLKIEILKIKLSILLLFVLFSLTATNLTDPPSRSPEDLKKETEWVDQIFNSMSADERLGQLFMIRAHSDLGPDHVEKVERTIRKYHVGGLCFFQGTPEKQAKLTNRYQRLATKVPLMISMDAEWGLGMRMKKSTISYPKQLMLGAIQDNRLLYTMGKEVARECRRLGVHINFAPVVDVNNNPNNPVINTRSFGEDRHNVAVKSYMYMMGMQDGNVMACAKHFPGHGDTDTDSHYDLPVIGHGVERLDSIELFPFKVLAEHGIQSMMVAHLHVPAIDATANLPTTLSVPAVRDLLKRDIGFDGLIFTDGLGMKGVSKHHKPGEVEAKALAAGNDVMLLPQDMEASIKAIKRYLAEGKLQQSQLDASVKKIIRAKYRLGLTEQQRVDERNIRSDLNSPQGIKLKKQLIENSLTLVRNKEDLLPFREVADISIATMALGSESKTKFQKVLGNYGKIQHFNAGKEISASKRGRLIDQLKKKSVVVVSIHDMSSYAKKKFGITESQKQFIEALRKETKVVLVVLGNPYALRYFDNIDWVLQAYDEDEMTEELAAQALFGVFSIRGRLPVTASDAARFNDGVTTSSLFRLGYDIPESVGLNSAVLNRGIDSLAAAAIRLKATPGCVVLVAKDGKVVFNKAYGHHTYSKNRKMTKDDIFDLASITKIAATTLSVMKLQDEEKINIYQPISRYLPELKGTNKEQMTIQDIMAHRSGLRPWIPFYEGTMGGSKRSPRPSKEFYSKKQSDKFSVPVTASLYMVDSYRDSIKTKIRDSELRTKRNYKYSDLGFYMLADMVETLSGKTLDEYAAEHFYKPLGLSTMTFNPWQKHTPTTIVPSEKDNYFRRQKVQGYVHDMGAAMLGGVAGHAGLFGSSNDLAIIMQMLLNDGYYGGEQYLEPSTVRTFCNRHPACTRRGIGVDMKEMNAARSQNMCPEAPATTFGHLGFTGTVTWADPENNIVYVFLSNRTYPSMKNYKLNKEDIRPNMQSVIYKAMEKHVK